MYQRTMNGPPRGVLLEEGPSGPGGGGDGGSGSTAVLTAPAEAPARLRIRDLGRRELAVVTPLIALIIALGVYPQPLIDLIRPAVSATMSDVGANPNGITPTHAAPVVGGK
jgi:NADH-quinone oxidoreductase subunit M